MAKRQSRRSISLKGITYQRLKNYARDRAAISGLLELWIAERIGPNPDPIADLDVATGPRRCPRCRQPLPEVAPWASRASRRRPGPSSSGRAR